MRIYSGIYQNLSEGRLQDRVYGIFEMPIQKVFGDSLTAYINDDILLLLNAYIVHCLILIINFAAMPHISFCSCERGLEFIGFFFLTFSVEI